MPVFRKTSTLVISDRIDFSCLVSQGHAALGVEKPIGVSAVDLVYDMELLYPFIP